VKVNCLFWVLYQLFFLTGWQEACKIFMVQMFEDTSSCMTHAKRMTVNEKDFALVGKLRRIHIGPDGLSGKAAVAVGINFKEAAKAKPAELKHPQRE